MITLKLTEDINKTEKLFSQNGFDCTENSGCVIAEQAKEMLGYCLFELKGSEMTVLHINPKDDIPLADGILRSTIHAGLEKGAVSFKYSKTAPEKLFKLLGFIKNSSDKTLDENKLFESCCKH